MSPPLRESVFVEAPRAFGASQLCVVLKERHFKGLAISHPQRLEGRRGSPSHHPASGGEAVWEA